MTDQQQPADDGVEVIRVGDDQGRGGLYGMVVPGGFERGEILLPALGFKRFSELGRFRDAWVERHGHRLVMHVYTRLGGSNRAQYANTIARLRAHPQYERDADDSFDPTYASFWFRVPDKLVGALRPTAVAPIDTGQRWRALVAGVQSAAASGPAR